MQREKLKKRTGTPLYMAPELFMRYYGVESDQVRQQCIQQYSHLLCVTRVVLVDSVMSNMAELSAVLLQWALGIMMYQLLSGHLPFWDEQSDRSPFAVMSAILSKEVSLVP